jgi:RHS repeat-associated protein
VRQRWQVLACILLCIVSVRVLAAQTYSNGYQYRRAIVLSHSRVPNTDQADFPVLVSGVYSYLANVSNGGSVQNPNGYDIVFSLDPEGATNLDHEIDGYDPVTGTANFWVRIPTLSHAADTVIYLFYGNANITGSQENKAGVWRNSYAGVWHLGTSANLSANDSTVHANNGTVNGSPSAVSGQINGAANFHTSSDNLAITTIPLSGTDYTVSAWFTVPLANTGAWNTLTRGINNDHQVLVNEANWHLGSYANQGAGFWDSGFAISSLSNGWHHLVAAATAGTTTFYVDGANVGAIPFQSSAEISFLGNYQGGGQQFGIADEIRISTGVARSADWVATEYANESSPSTFFTVEGQATPNSAPTIQTSPTSGEVGQSITIQGYGFRSAQGASTVTFNGVAATPTSWNDASIIVPVPAGATTGNLVVTVGGVASNAVAFNVYVGYTSGYQYRQAIVLSHAKLPNTDQTDFPVLISGVYSNLANVANGGLVRNPNGYDIIFSQDPEGMTQLDHEIESYDPVTGTVNLWVRIPRLSHTVDTVIYLFYGNPSITGSQENKAGVWRNGYGAVWHLGSGSAVAAADSTGVNNGQVNNVSVATAGEIGEAASFSGNANSYISIPSNSQIKPTAALTLEGWVNPSQLGNWNVIFSLDYNVNGQWAAPFAGYFLASDSNTSQLEFGITGGDASYVALNTAGTIPTAQWTHVVGTFDGSTLRFYINGAADAATASETGPISYGSSQDLTIGIESTHETVEITPWSGLMEELRISSVARSADWIATEYANQSSPSTFYTVEGQAAPNGAPTIEFVSPIASAIGAPVIIQGSGFQSAQGTNTVTFNGLPATPSSWNDASIVVPVPVGATTGNVVVSAGGVASNGVSFTVLPTPSITNLNPTSGPAGTLVTITGINFGATQGTSTVTLGGTLVTPTGWSATAITFQVPAWSTTGNVLVTANGAASNPVGFTVTPTLGVRSLSPLSGMVGTYVTITGTLFGATQGTSTIMLNSVNATVVSWNDTSVVAIVPSGATSGPFSLTVAGQTITTPSFTVTPLPTGWADTDIGTVSQAGSAAFSGGTFTVTGTGSGIGSTADAMHFVYQTLVGDGSITARLTSLQTAPNSSNGGSGVMIRETLNSPAADASVFYGYYNTVLYMEDRPATAANANLNGGASLYALPYWLRLVRSGNTFIGYVSSDGVNWTQNGPVDTVSMAQTVYVGLAVSGGSLLQNATFDSVSISSATNDVPAITVLSPTTASVGSQVVVIGNHFGATQNGSLLLLNGAPVTIDTWDSTGIVFTVPSGATSGPLVVSVAPGMNGSNPVHLEVTPQPLPTSWLNQDVGAVGQTGSASFSGGTFTVNGAGGGIGGTADGMQFVYQTLVGDGSIIARLTSLQNTPNAGTNAGVMIRETLEPGAADASVFYAGATGYTYMQDRPSTGATVSQVQGQYVNAFPEWMEMVRAGNTFTGFVSIDGINWTQVGSPTTISMAQTVYIGLVVSGFGTLEPVTFDSVSINSTANPAPIITALSATTASIGSQVAITGNNFGADQNGSILSLNGTPVTINVWSNTSIVFTVPAGATSGPLFAAVAPSMNYSNPFELEVTGQPLPSSWLDHDLGAVGSQIGSATYSSGVFSVTGGGSGIGGTADAVHFVYQTLVGDGSIVARINGQPLENGGVMIRETLNPNAAAAYVWFQPNQVYLTDRPSTGASVSTQAASFDGSYPYWLELVRAGSTFTAYASLDGVNWTLGPAATISMAQTVYIGLAVGGSDTLNTVSFDNVSVTFGTTPFVSGVTPVIGTIGSSVTVAGSNFGASQGSSALKFNGASATSITSWSGSQIVATVPSSAPSGTGPVTVTVGSVSSPVTTGSMFTVVNPTITNLTPPAAPRNGVVTIAGSGFGSGYSGYADSVLINGVGAPIATCSNGAACWSDTQIQALVAVGTPLGPGSITVNNDGYVSNSVSFTVTQSPVITSLSPTTGEPSTVITVGGSSFGAQQYNSYVSIGNVPALVSSWSDSQIVATVSEITMNGPVSVTVGGVTATGPLFIFNAINSLTASNGAVTTYSSGNYGGAWLLYSSAGPGCSTCSVRGNVLNTFDINGNLYSTTDANGNTVTYTYDGNNNMLSKTAQLNGQAVTTSYTYNGLGEVLSMTDPLGNTTFNSYDDNGNLLTVVSPAPNSQTPPSATQFTYNNLGELTQVLDPLSHATTIAYYSTGLIQSITDAQNHTTSYAYDSRGNRTSVIDPINGSAHPTTFAYDAMSRLTGITYPDGTTASFGYDSRGRRISATDQNNKTTTYAYDDADHLISVTDPASNLTQYNYDTENNLISITDANNHTTQFTYDTMGRVTQTTFPSSLTETYSYDQLYNLTSKTDRKGQTIQYVYDSLNRLTTKTYPDSTTASYVYDLVGKIQQVTDPTGTYAFAYDNMGRMIGTSTQYTFLPGHNFQNSYTYDAASNRTSLTAPDGSTNAYVYDTLNRLSTLTNSLTGQFGFGYDALSRRTQLTRPNGVITNYSYDSVSHLLSVLHQTGSTTLDGASYGYDYAGNRTSKTNYLNGITSNYGYDAIYELQQVTQGGSTTESYSYDAVGNRLSSSGVPSYSYNASNELASKSSGSYTYDANGNTLADPSGKSYSWDFENRLTSVTVPGSGTTTFKYDFLDRRIQKSGPLGTSNYLYDIDNLSQEVDSSGNTLARYTQSQRIDEPLAMLRSSTASYYQSDGLRSITTLSNAAGSVSQTYTYDSFGNMTALTGALTNPFRFTGREFDTETSLQFSRHRYYDASIGRFAGEDLIRFEDKTANLYWYVRNEPTNLTDPLGLFPGVPILPPCFNFGLGAVVMWDNYETMKAGTHWPHSDWYYHCMGNCQATNIPCGGSTAAVVIGFLRSNVWSQYIRPEGDWRDDIKANKCGQQGGDCTKTCAPFAPQPSPGKP